ncbi:DUF4382 domain-containing protein [Halalkalicoccus sp. GCM10025322]|uniref:DUF4382 domain-containing protein n=1 Tax=Halalkalicoccus TaxID=332246 RepID=UPI002F966393
MKRRQYIKGTGAAVTGSALAGCAASGPSDSTSDGAEPKESSDDDGSGGTETGTLATSVTDQPVDIDDFESCVITVEGLWVKPDGAESDEESNDDPEESSEEPTVSEGAGDAVEDVGTGNPDDTEEIGETEEAGGDNGRRYIEFDEPQEADLVRLQGANTQLIDETELVVGSYRYLQLEVSGIEGALSGGGEAEIDMPGNAPLQFKQRFEIRSNERTGFVADFAPVRRGQGDRYLLRPVAKGTQVLYGDEEYDPGADGGDVAGEGADEDRSDAGEKSDDVGEDDRSL